MTETILIDFQRWICGTHVIQARLGLVPDVVRKSKQSVKGRLW